MNGMQADPNVVPFIGGRQNDVELDAIGEQEAINLGYYATANDIVPTLVFCSPARRTRRTHELSAEAMGLKLEAIIDDQLQELSQGAWTNQPRAIYDDPLVKAEMDRQGLDFAAPGGESMNTVADYGENFLGPLALILEAMPEPQTVWVHTHGVFIKCLVGRMLGWSKDQILRTRIDNATLTRLAFVDGAFQPLFINRSTAPTTGA